MNIKLFITIGILHNLIFLSLPFLIFQKADVAGIIIYYVLFIVYMAASMIISVGTGRMPVNLWFFRPKKRIYSEWGEYWIDIWDKKALYHPKKIVYIYKLGFFSFNKIAEVDYIENLNTMKVNIKSKLDEINKKERTIFDDWDGYLDKSSGREDKLNKLGIN